MNKFKVGERIAVIGLDGKIKKGWLSDESPEYYSASIDRNSPHGNENIVCIPKDKIKPIQREYAILGDA